MGSGKVVKNRAKSSGKAGRIHTVTPKQQRFVEEYLIDLNATQAAIRAGYNKRTAEEQGYQLLQKTSVSNAVDIIPPKFGEINSRF